jgi:uncharacterized membrane protein YgcG
MTEPAEISTSVVVTEPDGTTDPGGVTEPVATVEQTLTSELTQDVTTAHDVTVNAITTQEVTHEVTTVTEQPATQESTSEQHSSVGIPDSRLVGVIKSHKPLDGEGYNSTIGDVFEKFFESLTWTEIRGGDQVDITGTFSDGDMMYYIKMSFIAELHIDDEDAYLIMPVKIQYYDKLMDDEAACMSFLRDLFTIYGRGWDSIADYELNSPNKINSIISNKYEVSGNSGGASGKGGNSGNGGSGGAGGKGGNSGSGSGGSGNIAVSAWDYILPTSNKYKLTDADVNYLTQEELRIARNEIYARHGQQFRSRDLQDYFNSKSWYVSTTKLPMGTNAKLSSVENYNIKMISKYEDGSSSGSGGGAGSSGRASGSGGAGSSGSGAGNSGGSGNSGGVVNAGDYILPASNKYKLTDADVKYLSKEELRIARNEIYARHGQQFYSQELQDYFDSKSWYVSTNKLPLGTNAKLSSVESYNIALISKYE